MIDFIKQNYREIIVAAVFIFEFVSSLILLIKKSKREPSTYGIILSKLPDFIDEAEKKFGAGHGQEKKLFVMDAIRLVLSIYGLKDDKMLLLSLSEQVEKILSTPTSKKGNL